MIDPTLDLHRARLARTMDHWSQELERYALNRKEWIINYVGSADWAKQEGVSGDKPLLANLIQLYGISRAVQLAYNDPRFYVVANVPEATAIQRRLEPFLDKYCPMIGLGDVGRGIALDSACGYGIIKVGNGFLPPGVQRMTGQQAGPMCWRVSQDNFGFDGSASCWQDVSYQYDYVTVPLDEVKMFRPFLEFNPDATQALVEYTADEQKVNSRIHQTGGRDRTAQPMVRLLYVYFPHSNCEAFWPAPDQTFSQVSQKPLLVREYVGHHTGPFGILTDLDIPDNLIPVSQGESVKGLHFLFNEMMQITANQALKAKINPAYEIGAQRDMERWDEAEDREAIPVSNISRLGTLEKPGPTQSQTAFAGTIYSMFKELAGNLDDTMGLATTAPTAKQSDLIRSATTMRGGELRRKFGRIMDGAARKLGHLALNDPTLRLQNRIAVPRSGLTMDVSWKPPHELPRTQNIDDFTITLVHGSMELRSPADRLASLREANAEIMQAAMAAAQGVPINMEKVVETQARYRDLPELRDMWPSLVPEYTQAKTQAMSMGSPDKPNGNYTRTNVSEKDNAGALEQNLSQVTDSTPPGNVRLAG